jgi:hypothetical protein
MSQFPPQESTSPKLLVNRKTIRSGGTKGLHQAACLVKAAWVLGTLPKQSLVVGVEKNQDNVNAIRKMLRPYRRKMLGAGWRNPEIILEAVPGDGGEFYKSLQTSMNEFPVWHPFCQQFAHRIRPIYPRVGGADIAIDPIAEGGHFFTHLDLLLSLAHQGVVAPINVAWLVIPQDKQSARIFNGILNTFVNDGAMGYDGAFITNNRLERQLRTKEEMDTLVALGIQALLHPRALSSKKLSRYDIITELTGRESGKRYLIGVAADETEYPVTWNYIGGFIPWSKAFEDDVVSACKKMLRSVLSRTKRSDMTGMQPLQGETTHIALVGRISKSAFEKAADPWRNDSEVNVVYVPVGTNKIVAVAFAPVEPPEIPANDGVEYFDHYMAQFAQSVEEDIGNINRLWKCREIVASALDSLDTDIGAEASDDEDNGTQEDSK